MRVLKKGSPYKEQVKVLQGLLCLHGFNTAVDGSFGSGTLFVVKAWQKRCGLKVDGSVGNQTWASLGVQKSSNDTLILKIHFQNIQAQKMLLNNGQKYPFSRYNLNLGFNFIINGGMFCMPSAKVDKKYHYVVTNDTIEKGQLVNGGNTSNIGIAFCNDRKTGCMYASTTEKSRYKAVDFIGGSPALYPLEDDKGLSKSYLNQATIWNMIGVDKNSFYYATNFASMKMSKLKSELVSCGAEHIINLDGGGSRALSMCQKIVLPTDGRGIPQAIGLYIKY